MKTIILNHKGSVLIFLIVMIVIMGVLTAAMTGMFSTASVGTVAPTIGNNAYYSAESAYRYVLYSFLSAPQNSQYSTLKDKLNQKTLVLGANSTANISIDTFFFAAQGAASSGTSLTVTAPVSFPSEYFSNGTVNFPSTGYLALEQSNNNPVRYTNVSYASGTFTFTLANPRSWSDGEQVYPAFLKSGYSAPVTEGSDLTVGSGSLGGFPKKNGVFTLATTTGSALVLIYERIDTSTTPAKLVNIRSAADSSDIPSGGLTGYGAISYVALLPNARITVQGNYGDPNTDLYNQRVITYYQPMVQGAVATKQEFTDNLDNLDNWQTGGDEVGDHAITTVDDDGNYASNGDNAMVVTSTEEASSLLTSAFKNTGVQESRIDYDPDVADFQEFWDKSDKKLSYEFQCKISFTAENDNAANNTRGTYMPGVLFRVRDTSIGSSQYVKEYYGMSFMRGLFDKDNMTDSTDSNTSNNTDADDIPDKHLFTDHGENTPISSEAEDRICLSDYTRPATWNDKPPISGVPYIVFWQQALNYNEYDGAWHADSKLYVDWLSYVPLCTYTQVTIYHYPAGNNRPEGWYSGALNSTQRNNRSYSTYSYAYKIERNTDYGEILQPVSKTVNSVNVTVLGDLDNTTYLIRDPATMDPDTGYSGDVIQNAGFIFPEENVNFQKLHNYRIYLKPWVTIMGRVVEMKGEYFNEDGSGCGNSEYDRINVIQAWFGDPDINPRGTIKWMDSSAADFSQMIWPDYAYTSKEITFTYPSGGGWGLSQSQKRLVERGDDEYGDSGKRSSTVYSTQLTSDNYDNITTGHEPAEVAIHTYGIDASSSNTAEQDIVYFDDFGLRVYEYGSATGLLPGVQSE